MDETKAEGEAASAAPAFAVGVRDKESIARPERTAALEKGEERLGTARPPRD